MFQFKPLIKNQLPLLFEWLSLPHISAWWRESKDYEVFAKKYKNSIAIDDVSPYLIYHDDKSIGYISWYNAAMCPIRTEKFPDPTYGIDLFIADTDYVGKGYGSKIIKQFIDEIIMPMKPKNIIVDPEITNERSIHVFEKAGFKKTKIVQSIDGSEMVTAQLMELDI